MRRWLVPVLLLLLAGCSGALGPGDLRSFDHRGMVLEKSRTRDAFYLHVQKPSGEQVKLEVTEDAYRLVGQGDALPLTGEAPAGPVEDIDEESAREGDGSQYRSPEDLPDEED